MGRVAILAIALSGFVCSQALAQASTQADRDVNVALGSAARACVQEQAKSLERSGQLPNDIATAALSLCAKPIQTIRAGRGGDNLVDELVPRLRDEAIAIVVQLRANRR